jgi:hypothetical protein
VAFTGDKGDFYPAASHWLSSDLARVSQHPAIFLQGKAEGYQRFYPLSQADEVIPPGVISSGAVPRARPFAAGRE